MEPIEVPPAALLTRFKSIQGWASGIASDSEDTLAFSTSSGVRAMIEKYPMDQAQQAYDRMMSGKARFRVVLMM